MKSRNYNPETETYTVVNFETRVTVKSNMDQYAAYAFAAQHERNTSEKYEVQQVQRTYN